MLVGIKGLGAEICKNLVLSGVKSVTIADPHPVNEEDFVSQFLVQRQDLGKNVSLHHNMDVQFQKIPIPPPRKVIGNSEGGGGS